MVLLGRRLGLGEGGLVLEAKGLHVVVVQMPRTVFADDVAATQRAIDLEDATLLLVGESYGDAVITEAGKVHALESIENGSFQRRDIQFSNDLHEVYR